jgi:hypothetical protein
MSRTLLIALLGCALLLGAVDGRSLAHDDDDDYKKGGKGHSSKKYHGKKHNNRCVGS